MTFRDRHFIPGPTLYSMTSRPGKWNSKIPWLSRFFDRWPILTLNMIVLEVVHWVAISLPHKKRQINFSKETISCQITSCYEAICSVIHWFAHHWQLKTPLPSCIMQLHNNHFLYNFQVYMVTIADLATAEWPAARWSEEMLNFLIWFL